MRITLMIFTILVLASAFIIACDDSLKADQEQQPAEDQIADTTTIRTFEGQPGVLNFYTDSCAMWPQKLEWAFTDDKVVVLDIQKRGGTSMDVFAATTIQDDSLHRVVAFETVLGPYFLLVDKTSRRIIGVDNDRDHRSFLPTIHPEQ